MGCKSCGSKKASGSKTQSSSKPKVHTTTWNGVKYTVTKIPNKK